METADDHFHAATARPQQSYDHRLRNLVQRTEDLTLATDLGVPRSTARGWLRKAPKVVVSLDVTDLRASELQQEVLELQRRVKKLTALLRLALALLQSSGFRLTYERLPDGRAKTRILRAWIVLAICSVAGAPAVPAIVAESIPPGNGCSTCVRLTISRPVRTRRPID